MTLHILARDVRRAPRGGSQLPKQTFQAGNDVGIGGFARPGASVHDDVQACQGVLALAKGVADDPAN